MTIKRYITRAKAHDTVYIELSWSQLSSRLRDRMSNLLSRSIWLCESSYLWLDIFLWFTYKLVSLIMANCVFCCVVVVNQDWRSGISWKSTIISGYYRS